MQKRSRALVRPLIIALLVLALPQIAPATPAAAAGAAAGEAAAGEAAAGEAAAGEPAVPLGALLRAALTAESQPLKAAADDEELVKELVQEQAERPQLQLSLLDAVEIALRYNLQAQVSRYQPDLNFEGITQARAPFDAQLTFNLPQTFTRSTTLPVTQTAGADVLTQENFRGGFTFSEQLEWGTGYQISWNASRTVDNSEFSTFNPQLSSGLSFGVQQPLLRNFGTVNRTQIEVAQNNYEFSLEQFRQTVQGIILQVYQAYWNLVGNIENVRVQQQVLDRAQQQLRRNEIQVQIGTLAPIEMVQAQRSVSNAQVQLIVARNAMENQRDFLKQLLNIEDAAPYGWEVEIVPTDDPSSTSQPIDVEAAIAEALEHDPVLRQLRIQIDSDRRNLRFARNQQLPNLSANAQVLLSGRGGDRIIRGQQIGGAVAEIQETGFADALAQLFSGDFNTWSVGLTLSLPLHNYSADAQYASASIRERQTAVQIDQQEQQVSVSVRNAARNLTLGAEQVDAATTTRELSERQLEAEQRKFEVGTSTNFQVLTFQDQLAQAQVQELQAIINLNNFRAQFEAAKGTLLESLGVSIQQAGRGGGSR